MANPEHLDILKQGVEVWNRWREENPDIQPDFYKANLPGMYLRGRDLRGVDFRGANLSEGNFRSTFISGADFSKANLFQVLFSGADLSGSNLSGASLFGADLSMTDLSKVDLSRADLRDANLSGATLSEANLNEAFVMRAIFTDVDLSSVIGLDTVKHLGPSEIGIRTIYRSQGKIPEVFLRGAGVPDAFIAYIASLTGQAIQYYSCFISYSHQDEEFAQKLYADLRNNSVICWYAPEDMKIGDKIRLTIDQSIRIHDKLLLILSEHSVASRWVEHEVEHALDLEEERGKPVLFPIRLDDAVMESKLGWAAKIRRECHIGDFSQWKDHDEYQKAFERLLRDLKAEG